MKKILFKSVFMLFVLASLTSCKNATEKVAASVFEKAMESATGEKIETFDIGNAAKTKATVDLNFGDQRLNNFFKDDDVVGMATAMEDALSITVSIGGGEKSLSLNFNGDDLKNKKPLKGSADGDVKFSLAVLLMGEEFGGMEAWTSEDAVGELVTVSDKKLVVKANGTLIKPNGDGGIPFDGTVTIDYPIFQAMGVSKSDFEY